MPNVNADALLLSDSVNHQPTPLFDEDEMRKLSESVVKHINELLMLYDSCPCTVLYDYANPGWTYTRRYKLYEAFCITADNTLGEMKGVGETETKVIIRRKFNPTCNCSEYDDFILKQTTS